MYKFIAPLIFIALLGACSSKSTNSKYSDVQKPGTDRSDPITKPEVFICDAFTEYPLSVSGEATDQLGTALVFTDFRYISAAGSDSVLYASTGAAMLDKLRMSLGEFPVQDIATAKSSDVLLSFDTQGISLKLATQNQVEASYHLVCENLFSLTENTCPSIHINREEKTVTFIDTELGESLILNGSFSWDLLDEYNLLLPSCLPPASKEDMIGIWDATRNYGPDFQDIRYIEVTETEVITHNYLGDAWAGDQAADCYKSSSLTIAKVNENGTFVLFDEAEQQSFDHLFRRTGGNRTQTFLTYTPDTLKPTTKKSKDFTSCSP